ncbi:orotidine-5'-phosphate decarboxylase [Pseudothermotoga thermarum]|uniref:Orotidine 5'-phosphate decarboxylase n=1 Tax=Pseudothermotoga thermarum DSM 5069 TaxID=688269 RepID=F7YWH4_9THEM|nr:orotidine-5'-phosphate decarboxylase [Pseudothermotoga thermarum]AEH51953.1 orotidine 5'-phosphate decarboxylase [Pseudothermotoga thermarum DSM 5069]
MKPVLSLDMENPLEFIDKYGSFQHVKIGHSVAIYGKSVLEEFQKRNLKVIVDLKFVDIPSTVARSIKAWDHECVEGFTVHSACGIDSIRAALESTDKLIFVVLKLTSLTGDLAEYLDLIKSLRILGCSFVLPGKWAVQLRKQIPGKILVPGVRIKRGADDQKDVVHLSEIMNVADYAVLGREIYKSPDPAKAMDEVRRMLNA